MDNPEKLETLGTQETRRRQNKVKTPTKGVNSCAREQTPLGCIISIYHAAQRRSIVYQFHNLSFDCSADLRYDLLHSRRKSAIHYITEIFIYWNRRVRDRMVVGFTTTHAISAYHH
jgi:hypothetical protein